MTMRYVASFAAALLAAVVLQATAAQALTMAECSAKYKAAKTDGSLNGMKWNDFRKAQCGSEANAAPSGGTPAGGTPAGGPPAGGAPAGGTTAASTAPAAAGGGNATFPRSVDAKYSKDSAGKARMLTCLDQYRANKADNGNGGMKWIQKGGGYYSECNKRLKGA
jgi:hypothetical protein